jgi:hypothetical protein
LALLDGLRGSGIPPEGASRRVRRIGPSHPYGRPGRIDDRPNGGGRAH